MGKRTVLSALLDFHVLILDYYPLDVPLVTTAMLEVVSVLRVQLDIRAQ